MQNHMRNTMHLGKNHEMKGCKLWAFLCPGVVKNTEKDTKLNDFHFLNFCEEGKSPYML